jgi:hypothetical protein
MANIRSANDSGPSRGLKTWTLPALDTCLPTTDAWTLPAPFLDSPGNPFFVVYAISMACKGYPLVFSGTL